MYRDEIAAPDEKIDLARTREPLVLVPVGKVQHDENVLVVVVDLRPLQPAQDVFQMQWMDIWVRPAKRLHICKRRINDVYPCRAGKRNLVGRHRDNYDLRGGRIASRISPTVPHS